MTVSPGGLTYVKKPMLAKQPVTLQKSTTQPLSTKVLVPPTTTFTSKSAKPMAAVDKMVQQKRHLAESVVKLRKIERVMVAARPDQATPFTYGEIFHQAAVSFAKMAALTTHISLESQIPASAAAMADQRRWSPELIHKFVGAINTFAGSLREVGDELKKRHEGQLVANLKRKADTEMAANVMKKLAATAVAAAIMDRPVAVAAVSPRAVPTISFPASPGVALTTNGSVPTAIPAPAAATTSVGAVDAGKSAVVLTCTANGDGNSPAVAAVGDPTVITPPLQHPLAVSTATGEASSTSLVVEVEQPMVGVVEGNGGMASSSSASEAKTDGFADAVSNEGINEWGEKQNWLRLVDWIC